MKHAPFVFGKVAFEEEFTNRTNEINLLTQSLISGTNTILMAPRRWGKSSLVQHTLKKIKSKTIKTCHIDLFETQTIEEFYTLLGNAILKCTTSKLQEVGDSAKNWLSAFVPQISLSPDPMQDYNISFNWQEAKKDPAAILNLAQNIAIKKNIKIIIAIDEFQNIASFDNPLTFQKKLRALWQYHTHVTYCLYGSKRHMLSNIFTNPKMPFYNFGKLMLLTKIARIHWQKFIVLRFKDTAKNITKEQAGIIADLVENHPYFAQQLAQQVWINTKISVITETIYDTYVNLQNQFSMLYKMQTQSLPSNQLNLLHAILNGESKLSSQNTLTRYKLGTSANVQRSRKALIDKEIIDDFEGFFEFIDPIYKAWLIREVFSKRYIKFIY